MAKKPTVTTVASGFNSTETLNTNFEALRDGFDNTLSLDGSTPNAMGADLDLNGNNIIGAAGLLINGTDYLADVTAAKAAALVAQAAAETAETNAEASETAVGLSATAAATSASAAAASEAGVDADRVAAQAAATAASTSETNAAASETAAGTSETNAATSETNAATSATNAATSATESETAKDAAETARDAALAALDNFDDRYLGAKADAPTVDNDGNALLVGALYFNTGTDKLYIWNGTAWQITTSGAAAGDLISTNNLSDVTSAATSRTNLGLGTTDSPTFVNGTFTGVDITGTLTASEVSVSKLNDANGDDALTITSDSTVQVHNEIEFIGAAGLNAHIQKNAAAGRDELQIYAATDANGAGSRGAGMHLYGNSDNEHSGNVAFITGPDDGGEGRMFVSGWDTNTHVTIGNGPTGQTIWEFVDSQNDKALLNLINPTSGPALFIMEANGSTEGDITVNDGENMQFGHWNYGTSTYTHRMTMTPSGLDVVGSLTAGGDVTFDTTTLHVDSTNSRVGIGTNSPSHLLDVEGSGDVAMRIGSTSTGDADAYIHVDGGDTGESAVYFDTDGVNQAYISLTGGAGNDFNIGTPAGAGRNIDFQPNNSLAMRINSSGNVGIGTSSPATTLDVNGTVSATTVDLGNWTVTESSGVLHFATGGTNKMKLDASGNLTVVGNVTAYGTI